MVIISRKFILVGEIKLRLPVCFIVPTPSNIQGGPLI